MLRMTESVSAEAAKKYFDNALSRGEYYHDEKILDQESPGLWGGEGARRLGLAGEVDQDSFHALCDNRRPDGSKLTVRDVTGRRVGYDLNFHVPKSVSVALETTGDERIVDAFREAVAETMRELERDMATRVRKGGVNEQRETGNMVWAEFIHRTSRPVEGVPDPHLHAHCFAFNATYDKTERRWKAGEFGDVKRDAPYHQAAFHSRLAAKLRELGYETEKRAANEERQKAGWELMCVSDQTIRTFSRRTEEIEKLAEELGVTNAEKKAELGARTRKAKLKTTSMEELRTNWQSRLSERENERLQAARSRAGGKHTPTMNRPQDLDRALDHAKSHHFENASVIPEKRLLAAALEHAVGAVTPEQLQQRLDERVQDGDVIRKGWGGQQMVTTREVLKEEERMLDSVRDGRGTRAPLKAEHEIQDAELSAEQRKAVEHVLGSTDSVILVRGTAGAGKTRLMREVVEALEKDDVTVQAAAPRAQTTHEVLRGDGFANAETVAHVLTSEKLQRELKDQVLWVDEAGQLSMPDMQRLVQISEENGIRLLLTGDTRQHRSVIRGDALRLMEKESGLPVATLSEIRRQKDDAYREAAQALSSGDLVKGYETLDTMGAIKEVGPEEKAKLVAETYADSIEKKKETLLVSPTHIEGREITAAIRAELQERGRVDQRETSVDRLISRHLKEAQKSEATSYRVGDVVQFQKHAGNGFKAAGRAEVKSVDAGVVTVKREGDRQLAALPLEKADRFEVYEKETLKLSAGDQIRITRNGYTDHGRHRLSNGAVYRVSSIDEDGNLTLANGWTIRAGFGHLDHGYVATSDASQGRTVDHLILAQSDASKGAASMQQFFTSVTRGVTAISVITNDAAELLRAVARDTSRLTGTEFVKESMLPPRERGLEQRRAIGRWLLQQQRSGRFKAAGREQEKFKSRSDRKRGRDQKRGRDNRDRGGIERER